VVGKNSEPKIEKTVEIESETFDSYAKDVQENEPKKIPIEARNESSGFVSYILLGAITFIVSMAMLYLFVK